LEQVRGLVGNQAGHQIFWFSVPQANLPGVISFSIPRVAQKGSMIRTLLKPFYLHSTLQKVRPDIVHVHYAQTGFMVFPLKRFHPLIVTVMGGDILPDQGYRGLSAFFIRLLLDHADCITSKSKFMDAALDRIGKYRDKIRRINWGVDLDRFHPNRDVSILRSRWSIPSSDLVFFDSRLARPFYNKHLIIEAFANYMKSGGKSATLLISEFFAEPAYLKQLKKKVEDLGITKKVLFIGEIPYNEMPDYYTLADVTISVPPSDGLPQTIYEAFACGSFLILTVLPQYAEIIEDGVNARLVPVGDVNALTEALLWVSSNSIIRQEAKKIGYQYVRENADFKNQALLVNKLYDEFLQEY
jgi:glycosyltransferase involved in cell wall biosynthesis